MAIVQVHITFDEPHTDEEKHSLSVTAAFGIVAHAMQKMGLSRDEAMNRVQELLAEAWEKYEYSMDRVRLH